MKKINLCKDAVNDKKYNLVCWYRAYKICEFDNGICIADIAIFEDVEYKQLANFFGVNSCIDGAKHDKWERISFTISATQFQQMTCCKFLDCPYSFENINRFLVSAIKKYVYLT